jgi:hypothetical protein
VIRPSQGRYLNTGQHKHRTNVHTDIHALIGMRTHDSSVRGNEDSSCLTPLGHCHRPRLTIISYLKLMNGKRTPLAHMCTPWTEPLQYSVLLLTTRKSTSNNGPERRKYSETSIYRSRIYRFPESIVQFLWSMNKSYLNYGNKTRIDRSSIYRFPASIGRNSWSP